jgi:hypothetical protein
MNYESFFLTSGLEALRVDGYQDPRMDGGKRW